MRYLMILSLLLWPPVGTAGLKDEMQRFVSAVGGYSNITGPAAYRDQMGGHFTGGNLFLRSPIKRKNLLNLTPPSMKSGNCGIDLHLGGFSFINSDQLVQLGKEITSSAVSFAAQLALETFAPSVFNIMQDMQDMAAKIATHSVNSCEAGKALVAGAASLFSTGNSHMCKALGTEKGIMSDWARAKQECDTKNKTKDVLANDGAKETSSLKDQLPPEFNLIWEVLKKGGLTGDRSLAESLMSISGTILGKDGKLIFKPSLATSPELLNALLSASGKGEMYHCRDLGKCLELDLKPISTDGGFLQQVEERLLGMSEAMMADTPLEKVDQSLLGMTTLPIWKMLNVEHALRNGIAGEVLGQYAEPIAVDMLFEYLSNTLTQIEGLLRDQEGIEMNPTALKRMQKNIREVRGRLTQMRSLALKKALARNTLVNQVMQLEGQLNVLTAERI